MKRSKPPSENRGERAKAAKPAGSHTIQTYFTAKPAAAAPKPKPKPKAVMRPVTAASAEAIARAHEEEKAKGATADVMRAAVSAAEARVAKGGDDEREDQA